MGVQVLRHSELAQDAEERRFAAMSIVPKPGVDWWEETKRIAGNQVFGSDEADKAAGQAVEAKQSAHRYAIAFAAVALAGLCVAAARCVRCGDHRHLVRTMLVVALACLLVGITAPIMSTVVSTAPDIRVIGGLVISYQSKGILSVIGSLFGDGKVVVASLIVVFSVLVPAIKMLLTCLVAESEAAGYRKSVTRVLHAVGPWSMADVFVTAILLAVFSLRGGELVGFDSQVQVGLWFFLGYCVLSVIAVQLVDRLSTGQSVLRVEPAN